MAMEGMRRFKEAVDAALNRLDDEALASLAYTIEARIKYYEIPECERETMDKEIKAISARTPPRLTSFLKETAHRPERCRKHGLALVGGKTALFSKHPPSNPSRKR